MRYLLALALVGLGLLAEGQVRIRGDAAAHVARMRQRIRDYERRGYTIYKDQDRSAYLNISGIPPLAEHWPWEANKTQPEPDAFKWADWKTGLEVVQPDFLSRMYSGGPWPQLQ